MNEEIKVIEIRFINGDTPLKAFVGVQIGDWTILDWRIVQKPGQRAWVSTPQISWIDADKQKKYKSLISVPAELKQKIDLKILSAWEEEKSRNAK